MIFNIFRKLVGIRPVDYVSMLKSGALILDVRTRHELEQGHIKGSANLPLDQLKKNLQRLPDKEKAIILCCASGVRNNSAKTVLKSAIKTFLMEAAGQPFRQDFNRTMPVMSDFKFLQIVLRFQGIQERAHSSRVAHG